MSDEVADLADRVQVVAVLQSQVQALQNRIKELEAENANLLSHISSCHCQKMQEKLDGSVLDCRSLLEKTEEQKAGGYKTVKREVMEGMPGCNIRDSLNYFKRYVALKVMYFGQRFYGFASEAQMDPTVESEIFKALEKTRLLVGDKKESQYSRCGRTDKGVSSVGQVIALFLRSKLKEAAQNNGVVMGEQNEGEIDYVRVLNRALPEDIRIIGSAVWVESINISSGKRI